MADAQGPDNRGTGTETVIGRGLWGRLLHTTQVIAEAPGVAAQGVLSMGNGVLGFYDDLPRNVGLTDRSISQMLTGQEWEPQKAYDTWMASKNAARQVYLYGEEIKSENGVEAGIQQAADIGIGLLVGAPASAPARAAVSEIVVETNAARAATVSRVTPIQESTVVRANPAMAEPGASGLNAGTASKTATAAADDATIAAAAEGQTASNAAANAENVGSRMAASSPSPAAIAAEREALKASAEEAAARRAASSRADDAIAPESSSPSSRIGWARARRIKIEETADEAQIMLREGGRADIADAELARMRARGFTAEQKRDLLQNKRLQDIAPEVSEYVRNAWAARKYGGILGMPSLTDKFLSTASYWSQFPGYAARGAVKSAAFKAAGTAGTAALTTAGIAYNHPVATALGLHWATDGKSTDAALDLAETTIEAVGPEGMKDVGQAARETLTGAYKTAGEIALKLEQRGATGVYNLASSQGWLRYFASFSDQIEESRKSNVSAAQAQVSANPAPEKPKTDIVETAMADTVGGVAQGLLNGIPFAGPMARVTFTNAAESAEDKARKAKEKASEWAETVANAVKDPHVGALMLFMGMNADDFKEGGIGGRLQLQLLTAVARFLAPVMDAVESWLTNSFNANAAGKPAAPRPAETVEARNAAPKPPQHQPTLG